MDTGGTDVTDHERIWLEPECCASPETGRVWCQDKVWPADDCEFGAEPTEYVLATALAAAEAREARLREGEEEPRIALAVKAGITEYWSCPLFWEAPRVIDAVVRAALAAGEQG
jgi:hypothetical protein